MKRFMGILAFLTVIQVSASAQSSPTESDNNLPISESSSDDIQTEDIKVLHKKGWLRIADQKLSRGQCHIYDNKGLMLYSLFLDNSNMVWVGDLPVGTYKITVSDDKQFERTINFDKKY